MTTAPPMTAEELERLYVPGKKVELVRGVPVVQELPDAIHSATSLELGYHLLHFVKKHGLGTVFGQDSGFKIASDPDTVRGADVAFVSRDRMAAPPPRGYPALAPDLVAEVLSPGDRPGEVLEKVGEWLKAGARLVWVVDPDRRQVTVYRQDGSSSLLGPRDALDGEDVLSGFSLPLVEILG
ncbi:MAG: Uma2 family endonuclease [Gemmatimonadetes bacterium]|nr:Uma2 family endonuclease [Gemmatimonadota bacterium]